MEKKTISVAMATYNGEKFLRKQLDSIYNQTLIPDEVVVSDDESSDGTLEILEEYHKSHGLKYSINYGEHGCNHNFYRAISLCKSDVIAISDQDDIWLPNKIKVSYEKLCEIENGKPACVSSLCNHIDKDDQIISTEKDDCDTYGYAATLLTYGKGANRSQGCSLMFNRRLADIILYKIKIFPEIKDALFYDGFISMTAVLVGNKYNLGNRLMLYRHHSSNVLAKEGIKTASTLTRIKRNDFYLFIPQARLTSVSKMLGWFLKDEVNINSYILCKKISDISKCPHYHGLYKIMTIGELSLMRKLQIMAGTIAMDFIKLFVGR